MPLAWQLVIDQTHSSDVSNRKSSTSAVCIVINTLKNVNILVRARKLMPVYDIMIFMVVTQVSVTKHHLSNSDSATPPTIRSVPNLEVPA